jgi:multiple sugar transport system permease protein
VLRERGPEMASRFARELTPGQKRVTPGSVVADLGILAWFVFSLFPLVWMVLLALKSDAQQTSTYFQFSPTLANFGTVLSQRGEDLTSVDFGQALLTSVLNCAGAVLVSLIVGIPAAYAAGRWRFRGSEDLMFQMLSFRFAPELMVIVPLFVIYNTLGIFDTKLGMVWVLQLVTMPLVVWIMRSYFQDLAPELEQAALLDGYTRTRAFLTVALPLVRPGIAAAALLAFIFAWNNYLFPLILTDSRATTVTVAVTKYLGGGGQAYYNLTAAAALLGALPPLVLALTIQRYLVRGLSFGAVKA